MKFSEWRRKANIVPKPNKYGIAFAPATFIGGSALAM
jgi:hypothetical protein